MSALYRVRQFAQAAGALVWPATRDEELAARYLAPAGQALFCAMPRYDRRHALAVARSLAQDGHDNPHLMAAALLHDAGKTCAAGGRIRLVHRVVIVLGCTFTPALLAWFGRDPAPGREVPRWRRAFYIQRHHAAFGAELARRAGCSPETVSLIRRHESDGGDRDPLLAALQAADSAN